MCPPTPRWLLATWRARTYASSSAGDYGRTCWRTKVNPFASVTSWSATRRASPWVSPWRGCLRQARKLLLAHHTDGVPLAVLAAQSGTSTGALATSLSRARAVLRVDFLSIYSKDPHHPRCRAVLIALSEGNARRQAALDAPGHLEACCHCATLARRLHHRNLIEREDRA